MIGDRHDFGVWRSQRKAWSSETCRLVAMHRDDSRARAFERVAGEAPCGGVLAEDLPLELQRIREALDVLRAL